MSDKTLTILIVDDDAAVRGSTSALLSVLGYRSVEAGNCEEALRLLQERDGDIAMVLLDLGLPDKGGREVVAAIRAQDRSIPIVLMSGSGFSASAIHSIPDVQGFLEKPFRMDTLQIMIDQVLAGP